MFSRNNLQGFIKLGKMQNDFSKSGPQTGIEVEGSRPRVDHNNQVISNNLRTPHKGLLSHLCISKLGRGNKVGRIYVTHEVSLHLTGPVSVIQQFSLEVIQRKYCKESDHRCQMQNGGHFRTSYP